MSYEFNLLEKYDNNGLINETDEFEELDYDEENIEKEIVRGK